MSVQSKIIRTLFNLQSNCLLETECLQTVLGQGTSLVTARRIQSVLEGHTPTTSTCSRTVGQVLNKLKLHFINEKGPGGQRGEEEGEGGGGGTNMNSMELCTYSLMSLHG